MSKIFLSLVFLFYSSICYSLPPNSFFKTEVNSVSELKQQVKIKSVRYKLQKGLNLNDRDFDYTINSLVLTKTTSNKSCKVYYYNENKSPSIGCKTFWIKAGTDVFVLPNKDIVLLRICGNICIENKPQKNLFVPEMSSEEVLFEDPSRILLPDLDLDLNNFKNIIAPSIRTLPPLLQANPTKEWLPNYSPITIEPPDKNLIEIKHSNKYEYLYFPSLFTLSSFLDYSSIKSGIVPETKYIQVGFIFFVCLVLIKRTLKRNET